MSFWKKGEDPWDIDPEKKREAPVNPFEPEDRTEEAGILEELADMFKKKQSPVEEETPVDCPWCGKPMERGYLYSGRDRLCLSDEKPSTFWGTMGMDTIPFCDEGLLVTHRSCWQCKACRKVVADFPEEEHADWAAVPPASERNGTEK